MQSPETSGRNYSDLGVNFVGLIMNTWSAWQFLFEALQKGLKGIPYPTFRLNIVNSLYMYTCMDIVRPCNSVLDIASINILWRSVAIQRLFCDHWLCYKLLIVFPVILRA